MDLIPVQAAEAIGLAYFWLGVAYAVSTWIVAAICGWIIAERKKRPTDAWAVLCFLFPMTILILLCLPVKTFPSLDRKTTSR